MPTRLPDPNRGYIMRASDGVRIDAAGQVALVKAGGPDAPGHLEFLCLSGSEHASLACHVHHRGHEALFVLEGTLDLVLDGSRERLEPGGYASVPPGVPHAYLMRAPRTRIATWTIGGGAVRLHDVLAGTHDRPLPADTDSAWTACPTPPRQWRPRGLPDDVMPYVLNQGEGEHLAAGRQVFTLLSTQRATGGGFLTVSTEGGPDAATPLHYHNRHTEAFFCVEGQMTMWLDGVQHTLTAGDFVHVPPGAVHAYRLDSPRTRFLGVLSPGISEPFFRALCEPWPSAAPPGLPLPYRLDRVAPAADMLDVHFLGPPF